jgi:CRP/FNR family transcriptional regulator, cyclic AMP receptor protein
VARTDAAADLLQAVPLFADLSKSELRIVAGITKPLDFDPGAAVVTQGERTGRFFVIMDGDVEVVVDGRFVRRLGPGDFFGEMALLDDEPRSATVAALNPLSTLSIAAFNFRSLLKSNASITYKVLVSLCQRVRAAERSRF